MERYEVVMQTMRPSVAWAALWSVVSQLHQPERVLVADNGEVSVTSRMEWRFVVDVLAAKGIPVVVTRQTPQAHPYRTQAELVRSVRTPAVLCVDDDVLLEPGVASATVGSLGDLVRIVGAAQLTPNNEQRVNGWQHPNSDDPSFGRLPDGLYQRERVSTHATAFYRSDYMRDVYDEAMLHAALGGIRSGSDDFMCRRVGGVFQTFLDRALAWEMNHPENRRWRANVEGDA